MVENSAKKLTIKDVDKKFEDFKVLFEEFKVDMYAKFGKIESYINESESKVVDNAMALEIRKDLNILKNRFDKKMSEGISMNDVLKSHDKPALEAGDGKLRTRNGTVETPDLKRKVIPKPVYNFR